MDAEKDGLRTDILEQTAMPQDQQRHELLDRGYQAIRGFLVRSGVDLTPERSRVAFYDDSSRHTDPNLGGTAANGSEILRSALVQVWEVGAEHTIQIHIYDEDGPATTALRQLYSLSEATLPPENRKFDVRAIAYELPTEAFIDFVGKIETLGTAN